MSFVSTRDLKMVWRILVGIGAFQLIGAGIGLAYGFLPEWPGLVGALASLPGFLLGAVWHLRTCGFRESGRAPFFIGFLALLLTGFAAGFMLPRALHQRDALAEMSKFNPADFSRIEITALRGSAVTRTLTDAEAVMSFVRACSDVVAYHPNHPGYDRVWHVVLAGAMHREYELMLSPSDPSRVFGSFVEKDGRRTWYHGSFQSQGLRAWVWRHLEVAAK